MPRFYELALPLALVLLQQIWSVIYPLLPEREAFVEEAKREDGLAPTGTGSTLGQVEDVPTAQASGEVAPASSSVQWLQKEPSGPLPSNTWELPVFPLAGTFYGLHSRPTLQIFEPRYRQLYHDAISGRREFAVTAVDPDSGRLAAYGTLFRIENLTDVAEQTGGRIKYLSEHAVPSRVRIHEFVNPVALTDTSTYLRAATSPVEDDGEEAEDSSELEAETMEAFSAVMAASDFEADGPTNASRSGLWHLASQWINGYLAHRAGASQRQLLAQIQEVYQAYASEKEPLKPGDLPEAVRAEVRDLKDVFGAEFRRFAREQVTLGQLLLQSRSHKDRLKLLRSAIQVERLFAAAMDPAAQGVAFAG